MNSYLWVACLFGITIVMFLLGYQPLFFNMMDKYQTLSINDIPGLIQQYLITSNGWLTIGSAIAVGAVLSGFNLLALVPFVLANILLNLFVLPTSYISDSALPAEIKLAITAFFTVTTYLVWISFVRQGG